MSGHPLAPLCRQRRPSRRPRFRWRWSLLRRAPPLVVQKQRWWLAPQRPDLGAIPCADTQQGDDSGWRLGGLTCQWLCSDPQRHDLGAKGGVVTQHRGLRDVGRGMDKGIVEASARDGGRGGAKSRLWRVWAYHRRRFWTIDACSLACAGVCFVCCVCFSLVCAWFACGCVCVWEGG